MAREAQLKPLAGEERLGDSIKHKKILKQTVFVIKSNAGFMSSSTTRFIISLFLNFVTDTIPSFHETVPLLDYYLGLFANQFFVLFTRFFKISMHWVVKEQGA